MLLWLCFLVLAMLATLCRPLREYKGNCPAKDPFWLSRCAMLPSISMLRGPSRSISQLLSPAPTAYTAHNWTLQLFEIGSFGPGALEIRDLSLLRSPFELDGRHFASKAFFFFFEMFGWELGASETSLMLAEEHIALLGDPEVRCDIKWAECAILRDSI